MFAHIETDKRAEWIILMNTVLYLSAAGAAYETRAYSTADITRLVCDQGLQSLTSADRQFDFWFSPSTGRCQRRVNRNATDLLLATTTFGAKTVPLLRGGVVIATHDRDGDLDGLSWQQLDLLARLSRTITKRDDRRLNRRVLRAEASTRPAGTAAVTSPAPVMHHPVS